MIEIMFCLLLFIIIARCYDYQIIVPIAVATIIMIIIRMRSTNHESQTLGRVASDEMALTVLRAWIQAVDLSGSFCFLIA